MSVSQVSSAELIAQFEVPDPLGAWIDGSWVLKPGSSEIVIEDPYDGSTIGTLIDSDVSVVDSAVLAADRAYQEWRRVAPEERSRILFRIAGEIRDNAEELASLESIDTGKPISQARRDIQISARFFEFYGGMADKINGESLPTALGTFAYTIREPYGVVAHITPWNSPLFQMSRGVAPSLAAGNVVVVKPSELTSITTLLVGRLFERAGLPKGVFNVVPGYGATAGLALVQHPLVRHITFTGSVATGSDVMGVAARRIVPCNLELGGKSPTIVLADANLEAASTAGARAIIANSGQICYATTRLIVHDSICDEFTDRVFTKLSALSLGRGLDDPDMGPLISRIQRDRVMSYIDTAQSLDLKVMQPACTLPVEGYFVAPTLLADVENYMSVAREEIFGPVQCVIRFSEDEEALSIANDSEYGLAAGIFTTNLTSAHRLARELQVGTVQINRYPLSTVDTPFGGYKQSGIGREKGLQALDHYSQTKSVIIALD